MALGSGSRVVVRAMSVSQQKGQQKGKFETAWKSEKFTLEACEPLAHLSCIYIYLHMTNISPARFGYPSSWGTRQGHLASGSLATPPPRSAPQNPHFAQVRGFSGQSYHPQFFLGWVFFGVFGRVFRAKKGFFSYKSGGGGGGGIGGFWGFLMR